MGMLKPRKNGTVLWYIVCGDPIWHFSPWYCSIVPTDEDIAALPHFRRDQLTLTKFLGSGAFGEVFEGIARNILSNSSGESRVAVKVGVYYTQIPYSNHMTYYAIILYTVQPVFKEHSDQRTPSDQGTFFLTVSLTFPILSTGNLRWRDPCPVGTLSPGYWGIPLTQVSLFIYPAIIDILWSVMMLCIACGLAQKICILKSNIEAELHLHSFYDVIIDNVTWQLTW